MGSNIIYRANIKDSNQPKPAASFVRLRPRYDAIAAAEVMAVNADVTTVVTTVSGAATRSVELTDELVKLPGYDAQSLSELQDCADGLSFAEGEYRATLRTMNELSDCAREVTQTRELFLVDLKSMASHAVIEEGYLKEYTGGPGFNNMIDDVRFMLRVYRNNWEAMSGRTCRTLEELDRAEVVVHRMEHLIGLKSLGTAALTQTADLRNRAFTYLVKRYDELCRAVSFVRWSQGDADQFAPSLYANRGGRRKAQPEKEAPQPPPQPAIGANGPFMPATPSPASGNTTPERGGNASPTPERIPGMPGGSPFIQ